jgi:molybdate transport system substrate-binding protein
MNRTEVLKLMVKRIYLFLILVLTVISCVRRPAEIPIHIAVASNFAGAMKEITQVFEQQTGHEVILVFGSTGKHYAQIKNGAPFEAFFAADADRPQRLEDEGIALAGSRFTYALSKVVLWSPLPDMVDTAGVVLDSGEFLHIAVANSKLAPYGRAAEEIMKARGVWEKLKARMVRGENISQAFNFIRSGNAELGFVALSQVRTPDGEIAGSCWMPPDSLHGPIEQQALLLKENVAARRLMAYIKGDEARMIIKRHGYDIP